MGFSWLRAVQLYIAFGEFLPAFSFDLKYQYFIPYADKRDRLFNKKIFVKIATIYQLLVRLLSIDILTCRKKSDLSSGVSSLTMHGVAR
jgi:hypothetical protein